jgi:hypothetical protein
MVIRKEVTEVETIEGVAAAAEQLGRSPDIVDLLILTAARLRIELDGEDQSRTMKWARELMGIAEPDNPADLAALRARGLSIREIASRTGLPKSSVQRVLSRMAA